MNCQRLEQMSLRVEFKCKRVLSEHVSAMCLLMLAVFISLVHYYTWVLAGTRT